MSSLYPGFLKGGFFFGRGVVILFSLTIREISNMYHHSVITQPLPLNLLSNESLVQMLSNDMLHGMFKCPTFSSIIAKYHTNLIKYGQKIWPCIIVKQYIML